MFLSPIVFQLLRKSEQLDGADAQGAAVAVVSARRIKRNVPQTGARGATAAGANGSKGKGAVLHRLLCSLGCGHSERGAVFCFLGWQQLENIREKRGFSDMAAAAVEKVRKSLRCWALFGACVWGGVCFGGGFWARFSITAASPARRGRHCFGLSFGGVVLDGVLAAALFWRRGVACWAKTKNLGAVFWRVCGGGKSRRRVVFLVLALGFVARF